MSSKGNGKDKPKKKDSTSKTKKTVSKKEFDKIMDDFHFSDIVMVNFAISAKLPENYQKNPFRVFSKYKFEKGEYREKTNAWTFFTEFSLLSEGDEESNARFHVESKYAVVVCCHSEKLKELIAKDNNDVIKFTDYAGTFEAWMIFANYIATTLGQLGIPPIRIPRSPPPSKGDFFTFRLKRPVNLHKRSPK